MDSFSSSIDDSDLRDDLAEDDPGQIAAQWLDDHGIAYRREER